GFKVLCAVLVFVPHAKNADLTLAVAQELNIEVGDGVSQIADQLPEVAHLPETPPYFWNRPSLLAQLLKRRLWDSVHVLLLWEDEETEHRVDELCHLVSFLSVGT